MAISMCLAVRSATLTGGTQALCSRPISSKSETAAGSVRLRFDDWRWKEVRAPVNENVTMPGAGALLAAAAEWNATNAGSSTAAEEAAEAAAEAGATAGPESDIAAATKAESAAEAAEWANFWRTS